jgi:chromosome segregation ATPase
MEKPVDESKVGKLEEKVNQQNYEIKDLTQRLMEEKETFDQQKIKFQTMITLQNQQMTELKKKMEETKKQEIVNPAPNEEIINSYKEKIENLNRKFNMERDEYEKKIAEIKSELKEQKEKSEALETGLNKYKEAYEMRNIENGAMKKQVSDINAQLSQLRVEIKNSKFMPRMFQVERIKDGIVKNKKVMTITFTWNKKTNRCEVIFKRMKHGGKVGEDIVNIIDISTFKVADKKKETVDIVFTVSFYFILYI